MSGAETARRRISVLGWTAIAAGLVCCVYALTIRHVPPFPNLVSLAVGFALIAGGLMGRFVQSTSKRAFLALSLVSLVVAGVRAASLEVRAVRPRMTRLLMDDLRRGLDIQRARTGSYPDSREGFRALVENGILDRPPRDAWGNEFSYALVDGRPLITSYGSDGRMGGEGDAADISNVSHALAVQR